jgi:hypothetical protein
MPGTIIALQNFTGGEVAPWALSARYDIAKYKTACRKLRNFIVELHGDLRRRPGTHFLADLGGPAVLLPFEFSTDPDQTYALVFQEEKILVAQGFGLVLSGAVPVEVASPYAAEDLYGISYAQSGDVVYLAHPNYTLRKLTRSSHTSWTLTEVTFTPAQAAPTAPTVTFTGTAGTFSLRYKIVAVDAQGRASVGSPAGADTDAKHPSDWVVGNYCTVNWSAVAGAAEYLIFREEAGYFGLVGVASDGALTFKDEKYEADTADTPQELYLPFATGNNPSFVAFHAQRLICAAGALNPTKFYGSRVADYENFCKSRPLKDDDMIEFGIAGGRIDAIQWACSFGALLLGTGGAEYKATGTDGVITPTNVDIKAQSYWGSARLRPLIIGNSVLHVQRQGSRVRDLFYSLEKDGYAGNDLSVLAPHLFDGHSILQWAYQQAPGSVVWAVRDDGVLLGLTYMKEHEVWGWHVHETDGQFLSVCTTAGDLEDACFVVVKRTVDGVDKYYLERLGAKWTAEDGIAQAFFLDSALTYSGDPVSEVSGLDHLEGKTVDALIDGSPARGLAVTDGTVALPASGSVIHVGLPFRSTMIPMTPEADTQQGTTLGQNKIYGRSTLRVIESVGGKYGPTEDELFEFPSTPTVWGEAVPPESGDWEFTPTGGYDSVASVCIVQDLPLPLTVAALVLEVSVES